MSQSEFTGILELSDRAINKFGQTGTGVAHCPCSNNLVTQKIPIMKSIFSVIIF